MTGLALTQPVFVILSALIEERTGLHYDWSDCELLVDKLTPRVSERGLESMLDYYYYLRYDPGAEAELAALVEALVVNETYFFRESAALEVVAKSFVPELLAQGVRPRIWSAACATGEEPLTLAMLLDAEGLLDKVTLVATDISARVLARAREGVYVRRSLRALPPETVGRWLEPCGDGMRVVPRIVDAVSFQQLNLVDDQQLAALGTFDFVLCRNVLIYFSDPVIEKVLAGIARCLKPEGRLLVGASESLLRLNSAFVCEEHAGVFVYRRGAT